MPLEWFSEFLNSDTGRQYVFNKGPRSSKDLIANLNYDNGIYSLQWLAPKGGYQTWHSEDFEEGEVVSETIEDFDWLKYMNRMGLRKEHVEDVIERVENTFAQWIKSSHLREDLEERYNRVFTSEFRKEYSGEALGLEGLSEGITPHEFQNQAVRWAAETGRGILGQDVGLGKTFIAILLAKLRKKQGKARRPFVVVPKSVATNWAEEVEALFPGSRVLVIGEHKKQAKRGKIYQKAIKDAKAKGLTGQAFQDYVSANTWVTRSDNDIERNKKLAMVKQNEYDLIICTKPAFERIPLRGETVERLEKQEFWYQRGDQIARAKDNSKSIEAQEKRIERLKSTFAEQKLREKFKHKESLIYWEDMAIDTLIADEAHAYKNLYSARSRYGKNPKFLGGSSDLTKQARKMQMMSEYVRDQKASNGVYFLTATPTKNSPLEVYNMLQHIAPEAFRAMGIDNSETFIDRFCKLEIQHVLSPEGDLVEELCVTGFTNLKELESVMDKYMMIQTAQDVGLKIPEANHDLVMVDMTDEQERVYETLRSEAENLDKEADPGGMLRIFDKMKKAAQDLEIYNPETYKDWYKNSPKYQACVEKAYEGAMNRGGQIIFCDHNASHERLKQMLMDKGLKENEIGIINAAVAADSAQRQEIGNKFNRNEIKVVIGNTGTMGEGVNLQGKKHQHGTTDIHHLDQPWDPGTMQQRNGRGVRQGNKAEQVNIHAYLSKGSFDGFRYGTLKGKQRWLDKLRAGSDEIANDMEGQALGDVEVLAMISRDPERAMRELEAKKAQAKGAWYIKQATRAINDYMRYQSKIERHSLLKEGAVSKEKLADSIEKDRRKLLRDELLPKTVKKLLTDDDRRKAAIITTVVGEGEDSHMVADIYHEGDVIISSETERRLVIEKINLDERTIQARTWMDKYRAVSPFNDVARHDFKKTDYKPIDELKETLQQLNQADWTFPAAQLNHIDHGLLRQHRDIIDQATISWYAEHNPKADVLVKTAQGLRIIPYKEMTPSTRLYYPWDFDEKEVINAILEHNKGLEFDTYRNDLIGLISKQFGMSHNRYWGGNDETMGPLVDKAKKEFNRRQKKAA
jgi:superfamily II DNA or RNA helicase